mmetsp:Transcript_112238/g.349739  ORF Transcript_112238/g.349739 Transcript_112238/m.349739 type:complete len:389 (-) Transcript_112238:3-1169(-)
MLTARFLQGPGCGVHTLVGRSGGGGRRALGPHGRAKLFQLSRAWQLFPTEGGDEVSQRGVPIVSEAAAHRARVRGSYLFHVHAAEGAVLHPPEKSGDLDCGYVCDLQPLEEADGGRRCRGPLAEWARWRVRGLHALVRRRTKLGYDVLPDVISAQRRSPTCAGIHTEAGRKVGHGREARLPIWPFPWHNGHLWRAILAEAPVEGVERNGTGHAAAELHQPRRLLLLAGTSQGLGRQLGRSTQDIPEARGGVRVPVGVEQVLLVREGVDYGAEAATAIARLFEGVVQRMNAVEQVGALCLLALRPEARTGRTARRGRQGFSDDRRAARGREEVPLAAKTAEEVPVRGLQSLSPEPCGVLARTAAHQQERRERKEGGSLGVQGLLLSQMA